MTISTDTITAFLTETGWADAERTPVAGDASSRSYERLHKGDRAAILMIAPPNAESAPCSADASAAERKALGYNAQARLAGPNLHAFIDIANALTRAGLSAPEIYHADAGLGLALIEDLGDDLFATAVEKAGERPLYEAAIDTLAALRAAKIAPPVGDDYVMLSYDAQAMMAEVDLLAQWYWPLRKNGEISADLQAEYTALWSERLAHLSAPHIMALRDFHAENLLWLPNRGPIKNVGMIDFQDALYGHAAYDLASLLEDARRDVPADLADAMIVRYADRAELNEAGQEQFRRDYAIIAAQRNAKILGIFARLAKRDNKPRYLEFLPRVEAHFRHDLSRPGLESLANFMRTHLPGLIQ